MVLVRLAVPIVCGAGFHRACSDLNIERRYLVHPDTGSARYASAAGVTVIGLTALVQHLRDTR